MITGKFGDNDELFFEINIIANNRLELPVDAMLDTGFSGWLAIDKQDLEGLGWVFVRQEAMRMAQGGDSKFDLYIGKVKIDREEFDIPVHVGNGVPEILIGRQWLKSRRLIVDMGLGLLNLGES